MQDNEDELLVVEPYPYSNKSLRFLQNWGWLIYLLVLTTGFALQHGHIPYSVLNVFRQGGSGILGKLNFHQGRVLHQGEYIAGCVGVSRSYCKSVYITLQSKYHIYSSYFIYY